MWQAWQLFEKFDPDYIAFEGKFLENDKNFRSEKAFDTIYQCLKHSGSFRLVTIP